MSDKSGVSQPKGAAKLIAVAVGLLGQDFDIFGPTLDDAVNAFIQESTAERIVATRAEVAKFLELNANDLDAGLERLGGSYSREPGMRAREYLHCLDGLLAKGLDGTAG